MVNLGNNSRWFSSGVCWRVVMTVMFKINLVHVIKLVFQAHVVTQKNSTL